MLENANIISRTFIEDKIMYMHFLKKILKESKRIKINKGRNYENYQKIK